MLRRARVRNLPQVDAEDGRRHHADETEVVLPEPADAGIDQLFMELNKTFHENTLPGCTLRNDTV